IPTSCAASCPRPSTTSRDSARRSARREPPAMRRSLSQSPGRVFYGWWIVTIGCVQDAVKGGLFNTGFTLYFLPVLTELTLRRALAAVLALAARGRARRPPRRISHRPVRRSSDAGRGDLARGARAQPALPHAQLPALPPRLHRPAQLRVPGGLQPGDPGRGQQ